MKKLVKGALAAAIAVGMCGAAYADKIGVVNYMTVFNGVPQGKATLDKMVDSVKPELKKLKAQKEKLQSQADDLQRNGPTMSKADRSKKEQALLDAQEAFSKKLQQLRNEQSQKEQAAQNTFEQGLQDAIEKVAKQDHYDLVLNSQAAPYSDAKYDISSDVIDVMKKEQN